MKFDVVALGELLIDFASEGTDSSGYPIMAAHPGGAPANYLAALARYGMKTAFSDGGDENNKNDDDDNGMKTKKV